MACVQRRTEMDRIQAADGIRAARSRRLAASSTACLIAAILRRKPDVALPPGLRWGGARLSSVSFRPGDFAQTSPGHHLPLQ